MDAKQRGIVYKTALNIVFMGILLFVPAGTLAYWQAWVYSLLFVVVTILIIRYFLKNDPAILERRSTMRENDPAQKIIIPIFLFCYYGLHVFAGFDHRFHWSHVSALLVLFSDVLILASFVAVFFVLKENSYASTTITVEKDQPVISTGPYALVRHPMYAGSLPLLVFTPLALGTAWGLIFSVALLVLLIFRLLNEERFLLENLPGYREYCQKTRYRLLPYIW